MHNKTTFLYLLDYISGIIFIPLDFIVCIMLCVLSMGFIVLVVCELFTARVLNPGLQ